MPLPVPDGIYRIELPSSDQAITDPGEGRYLHLLPHDALGEDASKIEVQYNPERGGYVLKFEKSQKFLTWEGEPSMNTKLITGDKPRYFTIKQHEYFEDLYEIGVTENKKLHLNLALERIYPPWVALSSKPEKQPWAFKGVY